MKNHTNEAKGTEEYLVTINLYIFGDRNLRETLEDVNRVVLDKMKNDNVSEIHFVQVEVGEFIENRWQTRKIVDEDEWTR